MHGYYQHHLTCRASSYSSCSHTRLLTYSHRQPYITAPNQKADLSHTRISIATTSKEMSFNPLLKQYTNYAPSPAIHFFKVKSHAGNIGNEHADALLAKNAKKSATTYAGSVDTFIITAGPEGKSFYNIHWLAKEEIENQTQTHNHTHTTNMAHSPPPKFWYLPNHRDALQANMHSWRSPSHGAKPLGLPDSHQSSSHQSAQAHPAHPPPPKLAQ